MASKKYYYSGDPFWTTLKKKIAVCVGCKKQIIEGDEIFKYKDGSAYCASVDCGEAASHSFEASAQDEYNF